MVHDHHSWAAQPQVPHYQLPVSQTCWHREEAWHLRLGVAKGPARGFMVGGALCWYSTHPLGHRVRGSGGRKGSRRPVHAMIAPQYLDVIQTRDPVSHYCLNTDRCLCWYYTTCCHDARSVSSELTALLATTEDIPQVPNRNPPPAAMASLMRLVGGYFTHSWRKHKQCSNG